MTNSTAPARWSKSSPSWGSRLRVQRNYYAFLVTMVMTDGRHVCPACDAPVDYSTPGQAEVDRAVPANDYREANITYLCRSCNQSRAILQEAGSDWTYVADYVAHVADASAMVEVPTPGEAQVWWSTRDQWGGGRTSRYA